MRRAAIFCDTVNQELPRDRDKKTIQNKKKPEKKEKKKNKKQMPVMMMTEMLACLYDPDLIHPSPYLMSCTSN